MATEQLADHVVVYKDADGDWRWTAKAGNYEVIADSSEGYKDKQHTIDMAKGLFPDAEIKVQERTF